MLLNLLHSVALGLAAALAVDFGFGVAFVDDGVAYLATAYCCVLTALLVGRSAPASNDPRPPTHWSRRMLWRLPLAVGVAVLAVVSLRSFAMVELPFGRVTTTGHSPYVLLPTAAVVLVLLLTALGGGGFGAARLVTSTTPSE
jgi:hypothetical protein